MYVIMKVCVCVCDCPCVLVPIQTILLCSVLIFSDYALVLMQDRFLTVPCIYLFVTFIIFNVTCVHV